MLAGEKIVKVLLCGGAKPTSSKIVFSLPAVLKGVSSRLLPQKAILYKFSPMGSASGPGMRLRTFGVGADGPTISISAPLCYDSLSDGGRYD